MHLNKFFLVAAIGLASLVALPAHAEETGKSGRLLFGPQIGFFTPASRLVRDRFGGSWTNLGLGLGDVAAPTSKGELNFDVNLISSRAKESEALLAPIGLVYRRGTSEAKKTRPYFGASVNFLVTNFRSNYILDSIPSGVRTGAGGSVFGGVSMGNRFYVEGRYYAFSKIRNFDFSGMNIGVGWRL
jgi:hypothetical protein